MKTFETTLTLENIEAIYIAMSKIKPIDRSDYFSNYYSEIIARRDELTYYKEYLAAKEKGKESTNTP